MPKGPLKHRYATESRQTEYIYLFKIFQSQVVKAVLGGFHAATYRMSSKEKEMNENCKLTDKFGLNVKPFGKFLKLLFAAYPELLSPQLQNIMDLCSCENIKSRPTTSDLLKRLAYSYDAKL